MKGLYFYNGSVYLVLRNMTASYFFNKQGELNRDLLNIWKEHLGADHILKTDNRFLFCETVPEPEWNEVINEILVADEEQLQPEQQTV